MPLQAPTDIWPYNKDKSELDFTCGIMRLRFSLLFLFLFMIIFSHKGYGIEVTVEGYTELNLTVIKILPPLPPVVAPPVAPPIVVAYPDLAVEAPQEIVVYVNESASFLALIQNTGNVTLHNLSLSFPHVETIFFNVTPTLWDRIGVNETKTFLVNVLSIEVGEVVIPYEVETEEITEERSIKIITVERVFPINITELILRIRTLEEMLSSIHRALAIMSVHGYPVAGLFGQLGKASVTLNQSLQALKEEKYALAWELFDQAFNLRQEVVRQIYQMARERELAYFRYENILFLMGLLLAIVLFLVGVKFFRYAKE
jgi:hypothetical protein